MVLFSPRVVPIIETAYEAYVNGTPENYRMEKWSFVLIQLHHMFNAEPEEFRRQAAEFCDGRPATDIAHQLVYQ